MASVKNKFTITREDQRKLARKVDRQLGLQQNRIGTGAHKTEKDKPRKKRAKVEIDEYMSSLVTKGYIASGWWIHE
jgi:hypothetical protein